MRSKSLARILLTGLALLGAAGSLRAYPEPSQYPVSWELTFKHDVPRRIVVEIPGQNVPKAYWYMTYTVTNNTDQEQTFLPTFEMVDKTAKVSRAGKGIPQAVYERIKAVSGNKLMEDPVKVGGALRVGEDQAKDSVAIWEENDPRIGEFSIFVSGLCGENTPLKDDKGANVLDKDGKPILLFKTLQLDYRVAGDEVFPGNDPIDKTGQKWIMR